MKLLSYYIMSLDVDVVVVVRRLTGWKTRLSCSDTVAKCRNVNEGMGMMYCG